MRELPKVKDLIEDIPVNSPYEKYPRLRSEKFIVADALELKDFENVLEVGTQWGESLLAIKHLFPDKKLTGIDNDQNFIDAANKTGIDIRYADVKYLPFKDNSFDVVFTNALLCMITPDEIESALKSIIRVAKKYIILVEFETKGAIEYIDKGKDSRAGADYVKLFKKYGFEATKRLIPKEVWPSELWIRHGRIYEIKL